MGLENRDNVTVSVFIITTSLMCHCNMNYNGTGEQGQCHRECLIITTSLMCHCNTNYNRTGEQGQCHREYHYHYNLLNVSL